MKVSQVNFIRPWSFKLKGAFRNENSAVCRSADWEARKVRWIVMVILLPNYALPLKCEHLIPGPDPGDRTWVPVNESSASNAHRSPFCCERLTSLFSQALSWPLVRPEEGHHTTSLTSSQVTRWVATRVLLVIAGYLPNFHQQIRSEVNLAMPVGLQVLPSRKWCFCFWGIICFVIVNFRFWTDCFLPPTLIFFI